MRILNAIYERILIIVFILFGKKPMSKGYRSYKEREINEVLSDPDFNIKDLKPGYGFRIDERIVEYPWLFSRLSSGKGHLLDAGSVLNFEYLLDRNTLRNKRICISTLAPEKKAFFDKGISYVYEDLRQTCYKNEYFDWIVSLSTVEHIGMDNTLLYTKDQTKKENSADEYIKVINEFHRILKPGGVLYISVPFGVYKDHGWLQVFDRNMVDKMIKTFNPVSYNESFFRYLADGWRTASKDECNDATYFDIQNKKKLDTDCAAAARAVACLEMIK